jgi:hypothetical protein
VDYDTLDSAQRPFTIELYVPSEVIALHPGSLRKIYQFHRRGTFGMASRAQTVMCFGEWRSMCGRSDGGVYSS